jgi:TfoX/Sxy family transcriptional regulator of competence genes
MAHSEGVDERIRDVVSGWQGMDSRKMFGGVCHLLNGNMLCGVYKDFLILRLGEKQAEEAGGLSCVRPFDITGRPMKGWVMVEGEGFASDDQLTAWLGKARAFVETLPPK